MILSTKSTLINLTENELEVKYCTITDPPIIYYCIGFTGSFTPHLKLVIFLFYAINFMKKGLEMMELSITFDLHNITSKNHVAQK